jgi:hypothetical protein
VIVNAMSAFSKQAAAMSLRRADEIYAAVNSVSRHGGNPQVVEPREPSRYLLLPCPARNGLEIVALFKYSAAA